MLRFASGTGSGRRSGGSCTRRRRAQSRRRDRRQRRPETMLRGRRTTGWLPGGGGVHGALSMTRQLRVAAQYARETGRQVTLYVLPDTTFSGRLEIAIAGGLFRVVRVVGFE